MLLSLTPCPSQISSASKGSPLGWHLVVLPRVLGPDLSSTGALLGIGTLLGMGWGPSWEPQACISEWRVGVEFPILLPSGSEDSGLCLSVYLWQVRQGVQSWGWVLTPPSARRPCSHLLISSLMCLLLILNLSEGKIKVMSTAQNHLAPRNCLLIRIFISYWFFSNILSTFTSRTLWWAQGSWKVLVRSFLVDLFELSVWVPFWKNETSPVPCRLPSRSPKQGWSQVPGRT